MNSKLAQAAIGLVFLAGLAYLTFTQPVTPSEDDCEARDKAADCWRDAPVYEFVAPDARAEPRP